MPGFFKGSQGLEFVYDTRVEHELNTLLYVNNDKGLDGAADLQRSDQSYNKVSVHSFAVVFSPSPFFGSKGESNIVLL